MNSKIWLLGLAVCLVMGMTSCKSSKQSAYKAAYERAKEKDPKASAYEPVYVDNDYVPATQYPPAVVQSQVSEVVKKEKVTTVSGSGLKRYSVVVGSFQNRTNATSMQDRMTADGFDVILALNNLQMYRVIVATYDSRYHAALKREEIKARYAPNFQDAWLLEQED